MKKSFIIDSSFNNMRIDRWIRHNLEKIPQGLIEKILGQEKLRLIKKGKKFV